MTQGWRCFKITLFQSKWNVGGEKHNLPNFRLGSAKMNLGKRKKTLSKLAWNWSFNASEIEKNFENSNSKKGQIWLYHEASVFEANWTDSKRNLTEWSTFYRSPEIGEKVKTGTVLNYDNMLNFFVSPIQFFDFPRFTVIEFEKFSVQNWNIK